MKSARKCHRGGPVPQQELNKSVFCLPKGEFLLPLESPEHPVRCPGDLRPTCWSICPGKGDRNTAGTGARDPGMQKSEGPPATGFLTLGPCQKGRVSDFTFT